MYTRLFVTSLRRWFSVVVVVIVVVVCFFPSVVCFSADTPVLYDSPQFLPLLALVPLYLREFRAYPRRLCSPSLPLVSPFSSAPFRDATE